jgi:hypothetical protein
MQPGEEDSKVSEAMKVKIPITEESSETENTKKIPKVVFIDNAEGWVDKYTDDALFA